MDKTTTQRYKELLHKETKRVFWRHFEGRKKFEEPILLAFLSVILYILGLFIVNGAITMNEIWIAIIPTLGVPFLWAIVIWYRSKAQAHINLFQEKQQQANILTLRDVEIKPYYFPEGSGYGVGLSLLGHQERIHIRDDVIVEIEEIIEGNEKKTQTKFNYLTFMVQGLYFRKQGIF